MTRIVGIEKWLILEQISGLGPVRIHSLLGQVNGNIQQLFQLSSPQLQQLGLKSEQIIALHHPDEKRLQQTLHWLDSDSTHFVIPFDDERFPPRLKEISSPPPLLFGIGNPSHLSLPQLAIVGSRNPTQSAKESAKRIARDLAQCGWVITSGLAIGIDGLAHQGALSVKAKTIAVLGTGIDKIYPLRHQALAKTIMQYDGCIISEFAPGTPAIAGNFPRRNRIISGLAMGTLVVEAAIKSGSLITARFAVEQGREVFAMPGNVLNPLVKGCHYLIKQGAKLVEDIDDINEEFQNLSFVVVEQYEKKPQKSEEQDLATDKLLDSVDYEATAIDVVAERSGLPVEVVVATLLEYELRGLVTTVSGGYIKLRG